MDIYRYVTTVYVACTRLKRFTNVTAALQLSKQHNLYISRPNEALSILILGIKYRNSSDLSPSFSFPDCSMTRCCSFQVLIWYLRHAAMFINTLLILQIQIYNVRSTSIEVVTSEARTAWFSMNHSSQLATRPCKQCSIMLLVVMTSFDWLRAFCNRLHGLDVSYGCSQMDGWMNGLLFMYRIIGSIDSIGASQLESGSTVRLNGHLSIRHNGASCMHTTETVH